ncbi:amino acid adenylation domain-containing protein [Pendulispora albinea]|uniref:Amino acid adenylation domain-containing protein n=1 Tax=Pendulispora albinea TaxID=2741071 RepID=A0ABZ2M3U7_9BACT
MTTHAEAPAIETTGLALEGVRLSPVQRRLWALHQHGVSATARARVRAFGRIEHERLARALRDVVARHEILRTTFHRDARLKFPLQRAGAGAFAWRYIELEGLPESEQRATIATLWQEAARRDFDLALGPVLDVTLLRRGAEHHELLLVLPALSADAWTLRLFVRELAEAYAHRAGPPEGSEEPAQYAQYSEWQNELSGGGDVSPLASQAPSAAPIVLPFEDASDGARAVYARVELGVEARVAIGLEALARRQGTTVSALLLAAWLVHRARLSPGLGAQNVRKELGVAVLSAGRHVEELHEVMGPVASWMPAVCRVDEAVSFGELVRRVEAALDEGLDPLDQDAPERTAEWPAVQHGTSDWVGFAYDEIPKAVMASGTSWQLEAQCMGPPGLKLALSVVRGARGDDVRSDGVRGDGVRGDGVRGDGVRGDGVRGDDGVRDDGASVTIWYDTHRVSSGGAATLAEQYVALVGTLESSWDAPVGALRILGAPERARRLTDGRGKAPDSAPRLLQRAFEQQAARRPDSLAVICGEQRLTYRELNRRANRLARELSRRGLKPGSPVGLCCERSADMIVGLLGVLKAGGAYAPLDPQAPSERLLQQLRQGAFSIVLTNRDEAWPHTGCAIVRVDGSPAPDQDANPDVTPRLDDLASVIFTSGSTGVPKGVAITHRGIANYTQALCGALDIEPGLHFATVTTLSADLGNTSIFASLATGGCLHVIDYETATDGQKFAEYTERYALDVLKIVPSHLGALLDAGQGRAVLPRRLLVLGGEALPMALADRIAALGGTCAVVNHYGPTETTVGALVLPLRDLRDRFGCASVPIGRPLPGDESYILDTDLEPAAVGTVGELYLGGAGLARGYLGRPDLTAERFVPHPFAAGARLYRTGDLARYRPDGTVEFLGRRDHQLKIRGFRVELGEIEARLSEHPAVGQAIVLARQDEGFALVAYVVPKQLDEKPHEKLDPAKVREFLVPRLPDYMLPTDIVVLPRLPLTANGKVDRKALPSPADRRAKHAHVAPRTPIEETLARIWADVLGVAKVGVDDDFFALGGHSLLAIPLMHRIQQSFGTGLSLMAIFRAPTVAGLAELIAQARAGQSLEAGAHANAAADADANAVANADANAVADARANAVVNADANAVANADANAAADARANAVANADANAVADARANAVANADANAAADARANAVANAGAGARASSTIVALRQASPSAHARPPLFCVDPTGRHVTAYQPLADALGDDRPVLGLDLGSVLGHEDDSIPFITEALAREVQAYQPRGPYHLLGWSLGGVLALGVARVLEARGESVGFLGILDTQPRTHLYTGEAPDVVSELAGYIDPHRREELLALPQEELRALKERLDRLAARERVEQAAIWAQARGFLPEDAPAAAFWHRYVLLRDAALFLNALPARALRASLCVWWSEETIENYGGPAVDWQAFTGGAVHTVRVPGDHLAAVQSGEATTSVRAALDRLLAPP